MRPTALRCNAVGDVCFKALHFVLGISCPLGCVTYLVGVRIFQDGLYCGRYIILTFSFTYLSEHQRPQPRFFYPALAIINSFL